MRRGMSYVLIILGLLVLLYPKASEWYTDWQQERLLKEWEAASYDETAEEQAQRQYEHLTDLFNEESASLAAADETEETDAPEAATPAVEASAAPSATPSSAKLSPIATISIESIKLKLPVLEGATQKNMKSAAAHLTETTEIGQVGNAAIAGHRMRAKGRLFNRLGDVEIGDQIVVETKGETYTYTVYNVSVVEPTDVSVLNYNDKDKLLTLITCDPIINPTHRLIIHAKMS